MADHAFVFAKESSYRDNHGDLTLRRMVNDVKNMPKECYVISRLGAAP